ncbi:MAG: tRNA 2-thiouridine(34) synthase MnmA [Candidatus Marinarcus sp.]|uniref:tRNA 2-thiouridine(34) synthase MnmA n=1 Tax=Candidatus Marinarcus sp. TaxID=3100987 RepID=UPI003AFFAE4F
MKTKIVVGMSGGIDSSVTAYMLQQQGYEVEGVYMKLHDIRDGYHENNIETGQKVARFLGIKYHVLDVSDKFEKEVYDYFVQSYLAGITPNPCVKCNRTIKFGALFEFAKSIKADFVATGHYAKTDGKFIYEAEDKSKDQSYFLAQVKKEVLPHIMFPMSKYIKEDIIQLGNGLNEIFKEISEKKESQEICFVENVYTDVIEKHANIDKPGIVLDENGKEVGIHKGYMHYTIGKRRGFTVHGALDPHFVKELNPKDNTIVVGTKESLKISEVRINNLNMYIDDITFNAGVKLRYRSVTTPSQIEILPNGEAIIKLQEPVYGVAKGQVAVFYEADKVLGSGWIIDTK